jgi:hypothetical protein
VLVQDGGRGTLLGCELTGNAEAGLEVRAAGDPLVRNCRIGPNAGCGVRVHTAGKGTVADCDLTGNARGPWSIGPGGQVTRTNNRE